MPAAQCRHLLVRTDRAGAAASSAKSRGLSETCAISASIPDQREPRSRGARALC
jgi:hypothetical protein